MADAMPEQVARRATKGFVALTTGRAVSLALQFVAFAITAGALGPAELGVYSFAVAFATLFRFVTNFGFRAIVARDVAQDPDREHELVANLAWLRFGMGVIAWVLVVAVVHLAGFEPDQRNAALITGALLVFLSLESFEITLEVRLRTGWIAIAEITKSVLLAAGAAALAVAGLGVTAFLLVYLGAQLVRLVIPMIIAVREHEYRWRPQTEVWLRIARASAFLGLAQLCIALYYRLDLLLLARFKPAADVGQYGAAYQFLETFVVLPSLAMVVLTPIISRSVVEGGDVLRRRLTHLLHLVALVGLPVALITAFAAWRVLPEVPGFAEYEGGGVALSVLAPSTIAIFLGTVLSGVLVAVHRQRLLFWMSLAGLGLNLVLNLAFIQPWSYVGAAAATSATEVFIVAVSLVALDRATHVRWAVADVARAARASVVLALVLALGLLVHPFVQVVVGVVLYLVVLLPTGSLRWSDLGGLVGGSGPTATATVRADHRLVLVSEAASVHDEDVQDAPAVAASGTTEHVAPGEQQVALRPREAWRALRGAGACRIRTADGVRRPLWLAVAARAGGCHPVTVEGGAPRGPVARAVERWFAEPPSASTGSAGTGVTA
jgi:O-antigen/teichoic acid export membrane protein